MALKFYSLHSLVNMRNSVRIRRMSQGSFATELPPIQRDEISSKITVESRTAYQDTITKFNTLTLTALQGGGPRGISRHVEKNKKALIRDRIKMILDPDSNYFEIGGLAGFDMMYGDVPTAGTVTGIGKVRGIYCMVGGNDATVKAGTYYPISVTKSYRSQEISQTNRLPCIYIPDSGGAFLPMQSEIFPDKKHGGRSFYNQAVMSSLGIHQIAVVAGSCTAGGAYNPTMSDEAIIVDRIGKIFLAGPPLVKAATGEVVSDEDLGGAFLHSSVSGCTDYYAKTEKEAFAMCRDVIESLNMKPLVQKGSFNEPEEQDIPWDDLAAKEHLEKEDIYALLAGILDGSKFTEFKAFYGPGLTTGTAYIEGIMVGVIANTGHILSAEAQKAAHFINLCSRRGIPILFLQNSLPQSAEKIDQNIESVVLKDRGKMCSALATATVPKISLTLTACSQDDYLLMCGQSFSPNFHMMWPSSKLSPFSMTSSSDDSDIEMTSAFTAAFNLLTDKIILPKTTRSTLADALRIMEQQKFNLPHITSQAVYRM